MRIKCIDCGAVYDSSQDHSCKPVKARAKTVFVAAKPTPPRRLKADPPTVAAIKLEDITKPIPEIEVDAKLEHDRAVLSHRRDYMKKYMVDWRKRKKTKGAAKAKTK